MCKIRTSSSNTRVSDKFISKFFTGNVSTKVKEQNKMQNGRINIRMNEQED
ncbi:hypothetical protein [Clostridium culturomicium]|uniref:hypothetical protein n=1 Tax=Clostridium culturomicium TaxID=1499683 RepID=UPI0012E02D06|nr:hypothetical protein [Clostridium culturomicium]